MNLTDEQKELAKGLRVKQLAFANLVALQDQNGLSDGACYIRAGYKVKNERIAEQAASRLLSSNVKIQRYLETFKEEAAKAVGLTHEYVANQIFNTLNTDISEFVETVQMDVGRGKNKKKVGMLLLKGKLEDLPEEIRKCLQFKQTKDGIFISYPPRNETYKVAMQWLGNQQDNVPKNVDIGSGNEVQKMDTIIERIATGEISLPVADRIMRALQLRADLVDQVETQERLKRIEEKLNG